MVHNRYCSRLQRRYELLATKKDLVEPSLTLSSKTSVFRSSLSCLLAQGEKKSTNFLIVVNPLPFTKLKMHLTV